MTTEYVITATDGRNAHGVGEDPLTVSPTLVPSSRTVTAQVSVPMTTGTFTDGRFTSGVRYTAFPTLPTGLSIDPLTGVISGTPDAVSAQRRLCHSRDRRRVPDDVDPHSDGDPRPRVDADLADAYGPGEHGDDVDLAPVASGFPGQFTYTINPTLPAGLSINTTTGVVSGDADGRRGAEHLRDHRLRRPTNGDIHAAC